MAGEEIRLGPFVGGLNTASDPTSIGDADLAELYNLELDVDGSLVNRPPYDYWSAGTPGSGDSEGGTDILGWYFDTAGASYLIASNRRSGTYYWGGSSWVTITSRVATAIVQYRDELWLITAPGSIFAGGRWSMSSAFAADANIPQGVAIVAHKDRLWVASGRSATGEATSRLYMSTIVSAGVSWPASKAFINIGAGDGQAIVDLLVYNSDLVIFKERSTYRFGYSADPTTGVLSRISATIGASTQRCVTEYQNQIYVLFAKKVFLFVNYNYEEINSKVPLTTSAPTSDVHEFMSLSVWADRLIVQYYENTYVYSLKTRTWGIWRSEISWAKYTGRFWTDPGSTTSTPRAYFSSVSRNNGRTYRVTDEVGLVSEGMVCSFTTKNFDYQSSSKFKRLFWWGIDLVANVSVTTRANPIRFAQQVTWDQVSTMTWDQIKKFTWDRPMDVDTSIVQTIPVQGAAGARKFIKLKKSLRFRQIFFKVSANTSGDSSTAPLRIFSLSTWVADKQQVTKQLS